MAGTMGNRSDRREKLDLAMARVGSTYVLREDTLPGGTVRFDRGIGPKPYGD
jgi:hypothetical protein